MTLSDMALMKRIILIGLLTGLATVNALPLLMLPESGRSQPVLTSTSTTTTVPQRDVFYFSDRFGFRFISPQGYIITPSETPPSNQPAPPLQVLELWQQADFFNRTNLPETPPIIRITVYSHTKGLPLTHWKGELSRNDDRPLTVAGQRAIAYTSTGLYESDNVLFTSPDGRYVFRLTVGYIDDKAPIRMVFQHVLSSFIFDVIPDSKAVGKWRINYSRLQRLLTAKNWQAADQETRAILQRLAGPKGDLLFSSKSVASRLPVADLKTLDRLWTQASGGRFGFTAQRRIWQQVAKGTGNAKMRTERFGQRVGWRRTQPLPANHDISIELSGTGWRLDSELNYIATAPVGHLPWMGVSSSQLFDLMSERSLGCGSCTIDAMYLAGDRFSDYLPAFFARY